MGQVASLQHEARGCEQWAVSGTLLIAHCSLLLARGSPALLLQCRRQGAECRVLGAESRSLTACCAPTKKEKGLTAFSSVSPYSTSLVGATSTSPLTPPSDLPESIPDVR